MSKRPAALLAARLLDQVKTVGPKGLIVVLASQHRAAIVAQLLSQMDKDRPAYFFPDWDCLPFDRAAPSADIMGHRMRVLRDVAAAPQGAVVIATPEAVLQRVTPADRFGEDLAVKPGCALDLHAMGEAAARLGYQHADRVEEPGQIAVRGEVVDVFPAGPCPYRITVLDRKVSTIHRFDPVSQLSDGKVASLRVDGVSEVIGPPGEALERFPAMEHWLPHFTPGLQTLFDLMPDARVTIEPEAAQRAEGLLQQIGEAHRDRLAADRHDKQARPALAPEALYLTADEWRAIAASAAPFAAEEEVEADVPRFHREDKPGKAFAAFLQDRLDGGHRVVLASARAHDLAALAKQAERATRRKPARVGSWAEVLDAEPGNVLLLGLAADRGFVDAEQRTTLIAGADLLGHHALASAYHPVHVPWHMGDGEFALGDVVIHTDHGVGILRGLENIADGAASGRDTVRLEFAGGSDLLVPAEDMGRVWRYGATEDGLVLDKLDSDAWNKRRLKIEQELAATAHQLVELAKVRDNTEAPRIVPPRRDFEHFVDRFPFAPTPDQMHAIDDVLKDMGSGRPMDRLVVGDVGFGKTEVAMRAAAAAVLAGYQVAVVAPTTVLVRQHVQNFTQRFAELGIDVAHLSRLVSAPDAKRTKEGLEDGTIKLAIGTHALTGKGVGFKKLGLLIIDEEQRFGTADKAKLRELGRGIHVLTMSATPIPRTLQSALVGLQDLSVIATPPARRRPIRTLVTPFDTATIRAALMREKARGGQSFVVMPRIDDLEPFAKQLKSLVPELDIMIGHGRMDPHAVDETMVGFGEGRGDVLLATSIIESGLDVPRANTMLICDAERFGLAQLHQMRGRVGRGRQQGICYLMTNASHDLAAATAQRLGTLAMYDRLGSGMAISARDLDIRGAGDLMGDDQAGHMRLIGLGLYQHLLQLAIRAARGEAAHDWMPELHVEAGGQLPESYIPEPDVRINLYARIARTGDPREAEELATEIADRFGPPPASVQSLLALMRLRCLCRDHGVARVDAGPKAIAFTPKPNVVSDLNVDHAPKGLQAMLSIKNGRLLYGCADGQAGDSTELAATILEQLA